MEEASEDEEDEPSRFVSRDGGEDADDGCEVASELSHVSVHSKFNTATLLEDWSSDNECHDQRPVCSRELAA